MNNTERSVAGNGPGGADRMARLYAVDFINEVKSEAPDEVVWELAKNVDKFMSAVIMSSRGKDPVSAAEEMAVQTPGSAKAQIEIYKLEQKAVSGGKDMWTFRMLQEMHRTFQKGIGAVEIEWK